MGAQSLRPVDVLIVGAGPAGLSTALHLLQSDPKWAGHVLLLEKAVHPRPKLCGGGVTRFGLSVLRDLGLPLPLPIPQEQVEDVRMQYRSRVIHVRGAPQFTVYHRAELDAYLAGQLLQRGGILQQDEPVHDILLEAGGAQVTTSKRVYRARIVVGADGSKGLSRRLVARHHAPARTARTLELLNPAVEDAPVFTGHYALFDFSNASGNLQGYLWNFPSRRGGQPVLNEGIYDTAVYKRLQPPALPRMLADFLDEQGPGQGLLPINRRLQGHPIHMYDPRDPLSVPGLLLAGDAAGIDPLFGEGIGPSLAYGQVAARAIQAAFERSDFSFSDYNRRVFFSPLGRYLTLRWLAARWFYRFAHHPAFMHLFWTAGALAARLWPKPNVWY